MKASCGKCKKWWTGNLRSHCGKCHKTFGGIGAFDAHWWGRTGAEGCKHPTEVGLVAREKSFGVLWGAEDAEHNWWESSDAH